MNSRSFSLLPLQDGPLLNSEQVEIKGGIMRRGGALSIHYELSGPPDVLAIPAPAASPARRSALWEETCFEFFLAEKDADPYWEFNISPAGDWNVYYFKSYRQGMSEASAFAALPLKTEVRPGLLRISLEVDLEKIMAAEQALDVGVSAVVRTLDGRRTYWALVHPGSRADFHRRDGFVLDL
jgi:hypothetical protein